MALTALKTGFSKSPKPDITHRVMSLVSRLFRILPALPAFLAVALLLWLTGCDATLPCKQHYSTSFELAACVTGANEFAPAILRDEWQSAHELPSTERAHELCERQCTQRFNVAAVEMSNDLNAFSLQVNRMTDMGIACLTACETSIAFERYKDSLCHLNGAEGASGTCL